MHVNSFALSEDIFVGLSHKSGSYCRTKLVSQPIIPKFNETYSNIKNMDSSYRASSKSKSHVTSTHEQISATAHGENARAEFNDRNCLKMNYGKLHVLVYWNCLIS